MTITLPFNELSLQENCESAETWWNDFFNVCLAINQTFNVSLILKTGTSLNEQLLCQTPFLNLRQWIERYLDKDRKILILKMLTSAQFLENDNQDCETQYNRKQSLSMNYAIKNSLPILSLASAEEWKRANIETIHYCLNESESEQQEQINNISIPDHLITHKNILSDLLDPRFKSIEDFVRQLPELFPSLIFHESVSRHLQVYSIKSKDFHLLSGRLQELGALAVCTEKGVDFDRLRFKNSPESDSRREQYKNELSLIFNGQTISFSRHFYFGSGRLYFHPDCNINKIYIGYIGEKIGRE